MSALDYSTFGIYVAALVGIVWWKGRGQRTADQLLLGERSVPTWAVGFSMVATELSAATFIGVPHAAYVGDWRFLQFAFGALLGKSIVAWWIIPLYHRLGIVTVYGYLDQRFGPATRRLAASFFVGGRVLASGVRLFIAALAFATVTGTRIEWAIVGCAVIAGLYTRTGGIRAVIWTDALQAVVLLAGALAVAWQLGFGPGANLAGLLDWAATNDRLVVFHWSPWLSWTSTAPFGVGLLGGCFLTLATHSTDHDMVQRLLTARSGTAGGRALFASALANFPLTALFLFIGTGLAFHYTTPPEYPIGDHARILPLYAFHELPSGLRGLLFAGLFAAAMSSLDSAICAISATWVCDVQPRDEDPLALGRRTRRAAAVTTVALTVAAIAMATYRQLLIEGADGNGASPSLSLVELALSSMTILYGGLLGIFAVGMSTRTAGNDESARNGLIVGGVVGVALFLHPIALGSTVVAWTWWIPISASITALTTLIGGAFNRGGRLGYAAHSDFDSDTATYRGGAQP